MVHEALARMTARMGAMTEQGVPQARAFDETAREMYDAWPAALAAVFVFLEELDRARRADRLDDLTRDLPDRCPNCPVSTGPSPSEEDS